MTRIQTGRKHRVVLIGSKRTPILSMKQDQVTAKDLGAAAIRAVIAEVRLTDLSKIGALIGGEVAQSAFTSNSAKHAARAAGLPHTVHCMTSNRQCSSSMDAAKQAFDLIADGRESLAIVLGIESMANTPYLVPSAARRSWLNRGLRTASQKGWGRWLQMLGISKPYGSGLLFGWYGNSGLATMDNAIDPEAANMSKTAQIVANLCGISREEADRLAALSQERAGSEAGIACHERDIVPFFVPGNGMITRDENPRATNLDSIAKLKALGDTGGLVTAANASAMGGCGVALMLASEEMARELGATILAEVVDFQAAGFDAKSMGLGPVPAIETMLARQQLQVSDIGYWEINEAFAHVWAAIMKSLGISEDKCNLYGGGISLGHPLGATGARLLGLIAREVHDRRLNRAVAAQCAAGGMGTAIMVQRYNKHGARPDSVLP